MVTLVLFWGAVKDLFGREVAYQATLLLASFPAAWLHAGVPLSDPAGIAAALGAWWLAIRAATQPELFLPAAAASHAGNSCDCAWEAARGFSLGRWCRHRKNCGNDSTFLACGGPSCRGNLARRWKDRAAYFRNVSTSCFGKRHRLAGFGFAGKGRRARVWVRAARQRWSAVMEVCWTVRGLAHLHQ